MGSIMMSMNCAWLLITGGYDTLTKCITGPNIAMIVELGNKLFFNFFIIGNKHNNNNNYCPDIYYTIKLIIIIIITIINCNSDQVNCTYCN